MAELRELLGKNRLVTLLGMGGIGKSRLSVQFAAKVLDDYLDGIWLVELAALSDPQLVPQAVASVLGVKEESGHPVIEALVKYVRDKKLLIILDNCEHVVQACAEVAKRLLQAGAAVTILATSRRHLQIAGEWTYPVPTLSPPDPKKGVTLSELTKNEAVRLFVDRAAAAQPAFRLSEQTAAAVAEVSHQLDGIPLAIELAAARTRAMPIDTIAARLCDRFRLLVTGDTTVLARQRTLRALIDWSYDLLPEKERSLFQRLSVFAGGWTLDAAEAVCAGDDIDEAEVLDLLSRLVEESLVILDADGGRYRMLDTVRHYAQERLREAGEEAMVQWRHLDHYLALAERARVELAGPAQGTWLARLDQERENLLSAHAWCNRAADGTEKGLRLVYALKPYWLNRGLLALGLRITVEALRRISAQERNFLRARGLFDAGHLCCFMGRYAEARGYLEDALSIARELGDTALVASILQPLGMACVGLGDLKNARIHSEEAVALARKLGQKRSLAAALNALAQLYRIEGNLAAAEPLYADVVALARELGDRESIAIGLLNLAMVSIGRGAPAGTNELLLEVLSIAVEIGSKPAAQSAIEVCAGVAAHSKDWEHAARFFGAAEALTAQTGLRRDPVDDAFLTPLIDRTRQALGEAVFDVYEMEGRDCHLEKALTVVKTWLTKSRS
ncbi:MAG TPA: tetratricopeptide repeat protein [Burkholderiaceae bacterium]|nr:tetratricopeptide repeat protein [Burkholderiaceae bacterium]